MAGAGLGWASGIRHISFCWASWPVGLASIGWMEPPDHQFKQFRWRCCIHPPDLMAPPRRLPAGSDSPSRVNTADKENISDAPRVSDYCRALCQEPALSPNTNKNFNLRKSIAWNPAFFTEQGVLDNSELSLLTASQLKPNASPRSPFCHSGRSATACVLEEFADNSHGKLPAKHEKQGRKLFSSVKTPQRDQQGEPTETKNDKAFSRSMQKSIPRVPSGSIQKKVPISSSTAQMPGIPNKSQPSLPTVPRSTSSMPTVPKSNIKLGPVKAEQVHSVRELPPKLKITSVSSGSSIGKDLVPAVIAIHETSGSVKCKKLLPHPKISPSSSFGGLASTFAKPSALRMPSPSLDFFTQENAHLSHGNSAKRIVGGCYVENTSSGIKPPRYKQPEDLKSRLHLTKPMSTNCSAASNLVLPVTRESNPNILVASEKESSSKFITVYSAKSGNANNQERPNANKDANLELAGNEPTVQPPNPASKDAARNSMPVVYSDTSHEERRDISKEIEPFGNSYPLKAVCPSTIEPVEDSLKSTCPLTRPIVGGTSSPSSISSRVCSSSHLTRQSKSESGSSEAIYLGNSYVGDTTLTISLSEDESCTPSFDFPRGFDSHDHQGTECATLTESVDSTVCVDKVPYCGSSKGETPALADGNSDSGDSLCNEAKPASSEPPNADGGMELETNTASAVKETLSLHEHNHNYRSTEPSPMKLEAPAHCVERQHALSVEPKMEDKMALDTDKLSDPDGASQIENIKALDRSRTNTILKDHLKNLVPFTEEWLAVMEARGQEVLEQKTGAVQNSPPDKNAPEPSPWSPVKRKAQDVGPFDCTKYSKTVRTSGTP